ncbi:hypothetical protein SLI_5074 [Streptomyces lividans 1326]|uniref:Uncharacterized protein n=1 Tax=Streptomyces lividans 1326 TaxID=1200984 RepID=A0A7U9DTB5_STRLI|nr:hypothetical protein SLI_5074 [Streptomyces lividans 1326]
MRPQHLSRHFGTGRPFNECRHGRFPLQLGRSDLSSTVHHATDNRSDLRK